MIFPSTLIIIQMISSSRTLRGKEDTYEIAQLLGQGQFGKVYRAQSNKGSESVAIKIIRRSKFLKNEKLKHLLERQMSILSDLDHPNVIQMLEIIIQKQQVCIVYEYCEGGTLQDRIPVPQEQLTDICNQIFDALIEAERKSIIHRDLKPANILFKNGKIKIADWGFSRLLQNGETTCSFIGSPAYMAPQALKGEQYTQKADIWSLGIVLYESLTGSCPWKSHNIASLMQEIKKTKIDFSKNMNISQKWQEIITSMLSYDPYERTSWKKLKQKLMKSTITTKDIEEQGQKNIMSCVFFLEMVVWSRKNIIKPTQFEYMIKLIQQNLLKLRQFTSYKDELYHVLEKQIKVVNSLRRKYERKTLSKKNSLTHISAYTSIKTRQDQENPQGIWQQQVKKTIKYAINQLQIIYEDKQSNKQQKLIYLNLLLDLTLFVHIPNEYLQKSFSQYMVELTSYHKKILLKLINHKLQLINKKYYQ